MIPPLADQGFQHLLGSDSFRISPMSFSSRAFLSKRVMRRCSYTELTLPMKAAISRP
jgi:hypothetical protein